MKRKRTDLETKNHQVDEPSHPCPRLFDTVQTVISNWISFAGNNFTRDDLESKLQKQGYCPCCFRSTGSRGSACRCYDLIHAQSELDRLRMPHVLIDLIMQYAQPIQIKMRRSKAKCNAELEKWAHDVHPNLVFHGLRESYLYMMLCERTRAILSSLLDQNRLKWSYYCNDKQECLLVAMDTKTIHVMKYNDMSVSSMSFKAIGLCDITWSGLGFMGFNDGLQEFTIVYRNDDFCSMTIPFHAFQTQDVGVCAVDRKSTAQEDYVSALNVIRHLIEKKSNTYTNYRMLPKHVEEQDRKTSLFIVSQGFCYGCLQRHHQCDGWKDTEMQLEQQKEVVRGNRNVDFVLFEYCHYGLEYKNKDGILFAYRSYRWKCNRQHDDFKARDGSWLRTHIHDHFTLDESFGSVVLEFKDKDVNGIYYVLRRVME